MQISQYYLSMVTRVIIFVLVTTSIIISIVTLGPLMEKLLGPLATYQSLLNGNTNLPVDGSATKPASVNDIINQITPEQRQQVDNLLNH